MAWAGELDPEESARLERYAPWFRELEATLMSKAYKMVLLLAMLERGSTAWHTPITPVQAAPLFHAYYVAKKFRMDTDWNDKETKPLHTYDETKVARLIARMPMTMWGGSSKGLVSFDGTAFATRLEVHSEDEAWLYEYTRQICLYRLHVYFERKGKQPGERDTRARGDKAGKVDFAPFRVQ
ncbi:MAG: hypothetical protein A2201_08735 [Alicyclobacillus sp. RIFOXYA1_FULL_53_8]|nr:MAG: hypothetical protein A2201_08735 [Alicyclobacillus sp. RIFOXYA1_FULL_53_8]